MKESVIEKENQKENQREKKYNSIIFKTDENDNPNEVFLLYYSFSLMKQSLNHSLQYVIGEEKVAVQYYINILDRWLNELSEFVKKNDLIDFPLILK